MQQAATQSPLPPLAPGSALPCEARILPHQRPPQEEVVSTSVSPSQPWTPPSQLCRSQNLTASEGTGWCDREGEKETSVQGEVSEGHAAGNLSSGLNSKARVLHFHHLSFSGQSCSPLCLAHCPERARVSRKLECSIPSLTLSLGSLLISQASVSPLENKGMGPEIQSPRVSKRRAHSRHPPSHQATPF